MKKILVGFVIFFITESKACDICGCVSSINTQGFFADYSSHFIGSRYSFAGFENSSFHSSNEPFYSVDFFNKIDLNGRLLIGKNKFVSMSIPYLLNYSSSDSELIKTKGIGDIQFFGGVQLPFHANEKTKNTFIFQVGIKTPTGEYEIKNEYDQLVHMNLQPGSGSFDYLGQFIYLRKFNKISWINGAAMKYNSSNKYKYHFGHMINFSSSLYWLVQKQKVNIGIVSGIVFEHAYHNTDANLPVFNTGGSLINGQLASQVFYKNMRFGITTQIAVYSNFKTDQITSRKMLPQASIDVIFFLKNKK